MAFHESLVEAVERSREGNTASRWVHDESHRFEALDVADIRPLIERFNRATEAMAQVYIASTAAQAGFVTWENVGHLAEPLAIGFDGSDTSDDFVVAWEPVTLRCEATVDYASPVWALIFGDAFAARLAFEQDGGDPDEVERIEAALGVTFE